LLCGEKKSQKYEVDILESLFETSFKTTYNWRFLFGNLKQFADQHWVSLSSVILFEQLKEMVPLEVPGILFDSTGV
jgi:hypothetical protein